MNELNLSANGSGLSTEEKQLLSAQTTLQLINIDELVIADEKGLIRNHLKQFLSHLKAQLEEAARLVSQRYFDHSGGPKQILLSGWEQRKAPVPQTASEQNLKQ